MALFFLWYEMASSDRLQMACCGLVSLRPAKGRDRFSGTRVVARVDERSIKIYEMTYHA